MLLDKDSPNTSTAKSSRRDSLNERVINAQTLSYEQEPTPSNQQQHASNIPTQSPPIHHSIQEFKQELPVKASNK